MFYAFYAFGPPQAENFCPSTPLRHGFLYENHRFHDIKRRFSRVGVSRILNTSYAESARKSVAKYNGKTTKKHEKTTQEKKHTKMTQKLLQNCFRDLFFAAECVRGDPKITKIVKKCVFERPGFRATFETKKSFKIQPPRREPNGPQAEVKHQNYVFTKRSD